MSKDSIAAAAIVAKNILAHSIRGRSFDYYSLNLTLKIHYYTGFFLVLKSDIEVGIVFKKILKLLIF